MEAVGTRAKAEAIFLRRTSRRLSERGTCPNSLSAQESMVVLGAGLDGVLLAISTRNARRAKSTIKFLSKPTFFWLMLRWDCRITKAVAPAMPYSDVETSG